MMTSFNDRGHSFGAMKTGNNPIRHPIRFKIFPVSLIPAMALLVAALINNQYLNALEDSAEHILIYKS